MSTSFAIPAPRRAEKKKVKLKMAVQGPSGSGKTWGALALAKNLWPNARICVVDTENGSSELYADRFEFDTISLAPPFHTDRYIACIDSAVRLGYDVLIIDQISHQWDGEGGILRRKEELDRRPGSNSFTNWSAFTPEHEKFKQAIVQAPIHLIATMRSKQDHIMVTNDKGKQTPQKVGLAPIQRDGFDYEFTLVFDVQMDHKATVGKDRTALFSEQIIDLASPKIADYLRAWMDSGATVKSDAMTITEPAVSSVQKSSVEPTKAVAWLRDGVLSICVKEVANRKTPKGKEYQQVIFTEEIQGFKFAGCWHKSLVEALNISPGEECRFSATINDRFMNIEDVLAIGGQAYRDGRPFFSESEQEDSLGITDDDIPF